jgi:type VI protein secretion system component VasK
MLLVEIVRRWGLLVLGVALLIVGVIVILQGPQSPQTRLLLAWGMSVLGVLLSGLWAAAALRRRRGPPHSTE